MTLALSCHTYLSLLIHFNTDTQVDRSLVLSKGREVAGKLLIELQVRKSTADAKGSRDFYNNLTKPIQDWEGEIRDTVLRKKLVRLDIYSSHFVCWGGEPIKTSRYRYYPLFF